MQAEEPDYSDLSELTHDWSHSVHGELEEILPRKPPTSLGKHVTHTHYVYANPIQDIRTRWSVTAGILHMINKAPLDWNSKKQAIVQTTTYE